MKSIAQYFSIVLIIITVFNCKSDKNNDVALFKKLSPNETKIDFVNQIKETKDFNILDYLYFYNGGGVAAGDINNDGLTDLFFVSNQGKNKLYLNKGVKDGSPQFEDISAKAGIEGFSDWKTGVTMADVNGDGLLDIYVCAVGNYKGLEGSNELYINNGNSTFSEKSAEYGLDFTGFSTQAAFFDFDKDGDLDMYLLNHAVHNSRSYDRVNTRMLKDNEAGDYLYRNDNGKFKDISKEAGIYQAAMGYGLGISVADVNNDGWLDIYVSNDFHEDDYYYINQKNGTFSEEVKQHFKHLSRFSMGSDIADINNDGFQDIMTLDMYPEDEKVEKSSVGEDPLDIYLYKLQFGYFNQYSRNCLQLSMGGKKFSDIAPSAGVMATDWSWSTLLADYDGDGIKDIFISNGILRRPNDLDYLKFIAGDSLHYNLPTSEKLDQEAIDKMPSGKWHNYLYKGTKELRFEDKSMVWGFEENNISNGAAYADLDNDGDLDLITNNLNEPSAIYLNNSRQILKNNFIKIKFKGNDKNTFGIGAKVILKTTDGEQFQQMMPTRGFMSSVEPSLIFGIGKLTKVDTMIVIWESEKQNAVRMEIIKNPKINTTLTLDQNKAQIKVADYQFIAPQKPIFEEITAQINVPYIHQENTYFDFNREFLIPFKVSVEGPKIAVGDVNGDGLDDFYVGGAKYQPGALFLQKGDKFIPSPQAVFKQDSLQEDVDAVFFDADGDKDLDLYVVSGGNEFYDQMPQLFDRLYLNDGKGNFSKTNNSLPPMYDNKSCVKPCDFDKDGDIDLFVGGRVVGYNYGKSPRSYFLVNNGKGQFSDLTTSIAPTIREAGMITDAIWTDFDKDGDQDLTLVGDWMPIKMFENNKGKFKEIDNKLSEFTGFWNGITAADFDKDGDIDFVVGNLGTNTKFMKEKGGKLKMLIKDIDDNKANDHILAYNRGEGWHPVNSKDEMGKQIPSIINKKYVEYKNFAGKTIDELFTKKELSGAEEKLVNTFESVYLENLGNKTFKMSALPSLAQVSKIMTLMTEDVDNDGNLDIIIGGNFNGANMYQARYDAFFGLILKGNGKGNSSSPRFNASVPTDNGFLIDGDIRDIKTVNTPKNKYYFVTRNNDKMQIFKKITK
jgi:hypothetical protein